MSAAFQSPKRISFPSWRCFMTCREIKPKLAIKYISFSVILRSLTDTWLWGRIEEVIGAPPSHIIHVQFWAAYHCSSSLTSQGPQFSYSWNLYPAQKIQLTILSKEASNVVQVMLQSTKILLTFSLSSSLIVSISLTGSTVSSTWVISESSNAPENHMEHSIS